VQPRSSRVPLLRWLLLWGLLGLALLLVLSRPLPSNDYSIYVAMGRQMLAQGALLERESFSFTQHGEPFQHASWAYALLCTWSHQLTGYQGIRVLQAAAVLATLLGSWLLARRAGAGPGPALAATLDTWLLLLQNLGARGQTLIYPLFLLTALLLLRAPRPWIAALAGAALGWCWTQLHGSFPMAMLYCAAVAAGLLLRHRRLGPALPAIALGAGFTLGTLMGPYGPGIWSYIYTNGAIPRSRGILEWYPPSPGSFDGVRLGLALLVWAALLVKRRGAMPPGHWLLLLGFGGMSLTATRVIAWFGLATAMPLALLLTPQERRHTPCPPLPGRQRALLVALVLAWLALLGRGVPLRVELAPDTPVALAERLAEEPDGGRVFAPMEMGGYLAWRFHRPSADPQLPLGTMAHPYHLDMRVWIWRDEVWRSFESISAAEPGWEEALTASGVRYLMLSHSYHGDGLLPAARASERWEILAEDGAGALFRRVD
jgi:hypothetical protein